MAATNYTPIQLYYSTTASTAPTAGNLTSGELAINITDGKLYYKNSSGVVTLLASATTVTNSFSAGTTGFTPNTATTGAVTLAGTLNVANGGTGQTTLATGALGYGQGTSAHASLAIGTAGQVLTVNSGATAPQWTNATSIVGGAAGSNTQVQYNNSGALGASSKFTFDGTTLNVNTTTAITQLFTATTTSTDTGARAYISVTNGANGTDFGIYGSSHTTLAGFGYLNFDSAKAFLFNSSGAEIARFTGGGRFGVGTKTPTNTLEAYGTSASIQPRAATLVSFFGSPVSGSTGATNDTNSLVLQVANTAGGNTAGISVSALLEQSSSNKTSLLFNLDKSGGTLSEVGRFNSSGYFGVNTNNPSTYVSIFGETAADLGYSISASGWNSAKHRLTVPTSGDTSVWSFNYNGSAVDFSGYTTASISVGGGQIVLKTAEANTAPKTRFSVNYLGPVGFGTQGTTADRLVDMSFQGATTSGANQFGVVLNPTYPTTVTSNLFNLYAGPNLTAGTTVTNVYGLYLETINAVGCTVTNRYGIYQVGTADRNYFGGNVGIGVNAGFTLDVAGTGNFQGIQTAGAVSLGFAASKWMTQQETPFSRTYLCGADASTYGAWEVYVATSSGTPVISQRWNAAANAQVNNLGVGFATPTTSGSGITFPATQSASSNANTLDDYEEGTFTPVLQFGGASVGITYIQQRGTYTKIGNTVTIQFGIYLSSKGSSVGSATVAGLPFTSKNQSFGSYGGSALFGTSGFSVVVGGTYGVVFENSTITYLYIQNNGTESQMTSTNFANGTYFQFSTTYQID